MKKLIVLLMLFPAIAFAEEAVVEEKPFDKALFRVEGELLKTRLEAATERYTRLELQKQATIEWRKQVIEQIKDYNQVAKENDMPPIK